MSPLLYQLSYTAEPEPEWTVLITRGHQPYKSPNVPALLDLGDVLFFSVDVEADLFVAVQDSDIAFCRSNDNVLPGPREPKVFGKIHFQCKDRAFHRHFHIFHR
jgi:hypothetical protein